jgi:hypothetical protein
LTAEKYLRFERSNAYRPIAVHRNRLPVVDLGSKTAGAGNQSSLHRVGKPRSTTELGLFLGVLKLGRLAPLLNNGSTIMQTSFAALLHDRTATLKLQLSELHELRRRVQELSAEKDLQFGVAFLPERDAQHTLPAVHSHARRQGPDRA